jgi:hypothetical protein
MSNKETRLLGTVANLISEAALLNRQVTSFLDIYWLPEDKAEAFKDLTENIENIENSITYVKEALESYEKK